MLYSKPVHKHVFAVPGGQCAIEKACFTWDLDPSSWIPTVSQGKCLDGGRAALMIGGEE